MKIKKIARFDTKWEIFWYLKENFGFCWYKSLNFSLKIFHEKHWIFQTYLLYISRIWFFFESLYHAKISPVFYYLFDLEEGVPEFPLPTLMNTIGCSKQMFIQIPDTRGKILLKLKSFQILCLNQGSYIKFPSDAFEKFKMWVAVLSISFWESCDSGKSPASSSSQLCRRRLEWRNLAPARNRKIIHKDLNKNFKISKMVSKFS